MNEQIKKLAEQAYALCGKHNNDYNGPAFTEAFAALVEAAARADEREQIAAWYEAEGQMIFPVAIPKIIRKRGTT